MEFSKLFTFASLGFIGIGIAWFVFSFQPDRYEANVVSPTRLQAAVVEARQNGGTKYTNVLFGFETVLPPGFTVDDSYVDHSLGSGKEIAGVAFYPPSDLYSHGRSLLSVEELTDVKCLPSDFTDSNDPVVPVILGSTRFLYASGVYVMAKDHRCYGIKYSLDKSGELSSVFDSIVSRFIVY